MLPCNNFIDLHKMRLVISSSSRQDMCVGTGRKDIETVVGDRRQRKSYRGISFHLN